MSFMDGQSLLAFLVVLLGSGMFLRIVAKEKRRREKYLELRLIQQARAESEEGLRQENQAARPVVTAKPADARLRPSGGN